MYVLHPPRKPNWSRVAWFESYFTKEECEKIIALGLLLEPKTAVIEDGRVEENTRKSKVSWIKWSDETNWIFDKLASLVQGVNSARYGMDLTGLTEQLQFTQYDEGDFYKWHQDFSAGGMSMRKLSLSVLLSDPSSFKGGDLKLFDLKEDMPTAQGTVIVFPSFEQHMVQQVTEGTRFSLVVWVSGPPYK